jgi:hypothetical protein
MQSSSISALNGGVSQRPATERSTREAEAQTNALNSTRGLLKRPPLEHSMTFDPEVDALEEGFIHPIILSATERFIAVIYGGVVKVVDLVSGELVPIITQLSDAYLAPIAEVLVGATPTDVVLDAFDADGGIETVIESHTPTIGGGATWDFRIGYAGGLVVNTDDKLTGNEVLTNAELAGPLMYALDYTPPETDYMASAFVQLERESFAGLTANNSALVHLKVRGAAGFGGYALRIRMSNPIELTIGSMNDGTNVFTELTAPVLTQVAPLTGATFGLRVTGSVLEALVDGVVAASATDSSDLFPSVGQIHLDLRYPLTRYYTSGGYVTMARTLVDDLTITYLDGGTYTFINPPIRTCQVDNSTIITDRTITVAMLRESSPSKSYEALIAIQQADFGTQYSLTLNGYGIALAAPEGVTAQARRELDTTIMASRIKELIEEVGALDAFTVSQFGSTLQVSRTDGLDFSIAVDDGLADNGLRVIKGTVQSFADLPTKAPDGFVVEVTGQPENDFDNYYVEFDVTDTATNEGVWRECVRPGDPIALDASTLPHVLTYNGSLMPESVGQGTSPTPTVAPGGGSLIQQRWDGVNLFGRGRMQDHGDGFSAELDDANGIETTYTIYFDVDTNGADPSNLPTVLFQKETGAIGSGVWETVTSRTYGPGVLLEGQSLFGTFIRNAGEKIRIRLEYADAASPTGNSRADIYTALSSAAATLIGDELPFQNWAIQFIKRTGATITLPPTHIYPQDRSVHITCDGGPFGYGPLQDATGEDIAIAIAANFNANATYDATVIADGQVLVERVDGAYPVIVPAIEWTPAGQYHDPNLSLVENALAGATIRNLTDGSEAVVIENTSTTIFCNNLTGGADNLFEAGDRAEVVSSLDKYFVYGPATWAERKAGSLTTNPLPSLVGKVVNEVFFERGRLGLLAESSVILSESNEPYNLFRTTVAQLLASDPIDVKVAHGDSARFHSAFQWNGGLVLSTGRQQYALTGAPILSPQTVSLPRLSEYPMDDVRPITLGRFAYFASKRQNYAQIYAYGLMENQDKPQAIHVTQDVPEYLEGSVLAMAGDADLGMLAVLTDADRSKVYIHTFAQGLFAWTTWQLPAGTTVIGMSFLDGVLSVLSERGADAFLDTMDVGSTPTVGLLDRRVSFASGTGVYAAPNTTWTLPYSCATDGSEGTIQVVNASTGALITCTRPTATTVRAAGDYSAVAVYAGVQYTFSHTLSPLYLRDRSSQGEGAAITIGRTQLSRLRIRSQDTTHFDVDVAVDGSEARSYASGGGDVLSVPVASRNTQVTITLSNDQPAASRILGLDWDANYYATGRRR